MKITYLSVLIPMLLMASACDAADSTKEKSARATPVKPAVVAKTPIAQGKIIHDAEFYILEKQNREKWDAEDKTLDAKLAEFRKQNGGKPPNIFYILIDDIGFGDLGSKTLNSIRGYETPSINKIAREGMRLSRMYTEPSCTPTRVAFMTGRQPYRNGMGNTSVD
ncbi:MAG: sulfatase-like hydrolase/transferase, partial [Gammaproteobacteria bacterium]|nr:sulfatase-like hydrolase/transferase [Gammaproteobacteria bacterium]MDX2487141.1 sulfatase-like hydrolase/transferase [Gammaproteobacteria bacterium]